MAISITCPNAACAEQLEIDELDAGAEVVCPSCETLFVAPETEETNAFESILRACGQGYTAYTGDTQIARGGMGAILQCEDRAFGRQIAVKVMHPNVAKEADGRLRFLEEAQITGQLEHPNIVPVHELGEDDVGNLFFAMKLVHGRSVGQLLDAMRADSAEAPSLSELLKIFLKVCDGVAFAHSKRVIHRDLKPDNIMLGDFGEVLVMDWGIAKVVENRLARSKRRSRAEFAESPMVTSVRGDTQLTQYGAIAGTPAYMPPEQARGDIDKIDTRSDIYSLGAILYELLTLLPPIDGKSAAKVLIMVQKGEITPPELRTPQRRIPLELSAVCMKAMHRTRAQRYQNVGELASDIRLFLEGRAVSAKDDSFFESIAKLIKRNKTVSISAAVALVAIAGMAVVTIDRVRSERDLALAAQQEQFETATRASKRFAQQAVEAAELDRHLEAARRAEDAEAVAPAGAWGHYVRGKLAAIANDFDTANTELEQAKAIAGDAPEIQAALAEVQARAGVLDNADSLLADLANATDWRTLASAGQALYDAGRFADCQAPIRRALELSPEDAPKDRTGRLQDLLEFAPAQEACIGFTAATKHLPHKERMARISEKLTEINGAEIKASLPPPNEPKRELSFTGTNTIKHLYPIQGLDATGSFIYTAKVRDLSPFRGMKLTWLNLQACPVSDRNPLAGMPLVSMNMTHSKVTDLSPLAGMKLEQFLIAYTKVQDLSPLAGMPLTELNITSTRVNDLSPLRDMPLRSLHFPGCLVREISVMSTLKNLEVLHLEGRVRDLSPLKGLKLKEFRYPGSRTADFSALRGMPIERFDAGYGLFETIDFLDGAPVEELQVSHGKLSDISALATAPLRKVFIGNTAIRDISVLAGKPIEALTLGGCLIEDLSPLATLEKIDAAAYPWVPFLAGKTTREEFIEALRKIGKPGDDLQRRAGMFAVMKRFGKGERNDAKQLFLEKGLQKELPHYAEELS